MNISKAYQCILCHSVYGNEDDARDCCYSVEEVYECGICDTVWDTEAEARECCAAPLPQVKE